MTNRSRRGFARIVAATSGAFAAAPWIAGAQAPQTLRFRTISDPDGSDPSFRLKGDWLVLEIGDSVLSGFGEASPSNDDEA